MQPFGNFKQDAELFGKRLGFCEPRPNSFWRRNHCKRIVLFSWQELPSTGLDEGSIAEVRSEVAGSEPPHVWRTLS